MEFNDIDCYKASKVCSETSFYNQVDNSLIVNVMYILKELLSEENYWIYR